MSESVNDFQPEEERSARDDPGYWAEVERRRDEALLNEEEVPDDCD